MLLLIGQNVIEILEITMGGRNLNPYKSYANPYKRGLESCGMIRGFQILSLNLSRISFDPFIDKQNWQNTRFCPFDSVLAKKEVKCYPI